MSSFLLIRFSSPLSVSCSDVGVGIPGTPVTLTGHLGYTDGPLALVADGDTIDWSLGGRASFGPVTVGRMVRR